MATLLKPAKAKGAQRVIEVLDFFDEQHRQATVMDIARRYDRPQSSTSELLASLVDLGLLYKDAGSRSYSLTPRAAILGSLSQPRLVRDGSLAMLVDDLRTQTGLGVALIGMVGPNAQVFRWKPGLQRIDNAAQAFAGGAQEALTATAAGWLLLSTLARPRREGLVRRLNAEARSEAKFNHQGMIAVIDDAAASGSSTGPVGFGVAATTTAILVPGECERPMAVGLVHDAAEALDPHALVAILRKSVQRCLVASLPTEPIAIANAA